MDKDRLGLAIVSQNNLTTITVKDSAINEEVIWQIVNYLRFEMLAQKAGIDTKNEEQINKWANEATQNWWNENAADFLKHVSVK